MREGYRFKSALTPTQAGGIFRESGSVQGLQVNCSCH